MGLDLFGEQLGSVAGGHLVDVAANFDVGAAEVDFDEVGKGKEGEFGRFGEEVVEGEAVALFFEPGAGGEDLLVGFHVFEDFEDGVVGRQQGDSVGQQSFAGAVDEGNGAGGFGHDAKVVVRDLAGGFFRVAGKGVIASGPEEQLIAVEIKVVVEDRLAAEKAGGRSFRRNFTVRAARDGEGTIHRCRLPSRCRSAHTFSSPPKATSDRYAVCLWGLSACFGET